MRRRHGQPLATATETFALVAEIDRGHIEFFFFDVFPNVHFCPVIQWIDAHVFARIHAGIVKIPDFWTLVFWIPLAERIAEAEETFFRARFFLVAPRATDGAIK